MIDRDREDPSDIDNIVISDGHSGVILRLDIECDCHRIRRDVAVVGAVRERIDAEVVRIR